MPARFSDRGWCAAALGPAARVRSALPPTPSHAARARWEPGGTKDLAPRGTPVLSVKHLVPARRRGGTRTVRISVQVVQFQFGGDDPVSSPRLARSHPPP